MKCISPGEIFAAVFICLAEDTVLNELEDDLPEILATFDAPSIEKGYSHGAILVDCIVPDAIQKLFA
jgi:hypothetical protein